MKYPSNITIFNFTYVKAILAICLFTTHFIVFSQETVDTKRKVTSGSAVDDEGALKKYTMFGSILFNTIESPSLFLWTRPSIFPNGEPIYYSKQYYQRYEYQFTPQNGFTLGLERNITINSKLHLSIGGGFEFSSFKYKNLLTRLDERIINKYEVITEGTPSEIQITPINEEIEPDETFIYISNFKDIQFKAISLYIPTSIHYDIFKHCYLNANAGVSIPVFVQSIGSVFNINSSQVIEKTNNEDNSVSRILFHVGAGMHYDIFGKYYVGINYRHTLNSLISSSASAQSSFRNIGKVSMTAIDVKLGYNF